MHNRPAIFRKFWFRLACSKTLFMLFQFPSQTLPPIHHFGATLKFWMDSHFSPSLLLTREGPHVKIRTLESVLGNPFLVRNWVFDSCIWIRNIIASFINFQGFCSKKFFWKFKSQYASQNIFVCANIAKPNCWMACQRFVFQITIKCSSCSK